MSATLLTRIPRDRLDPQWQPAWDKLRELTGSATFVEVFAQAPQALLGNGEAVLRFGCGGQGELLSIRPRR